MSGSPASPPPKLASDTILDPIDTPAKGLLPYQADPQTTGLQPPQLQAPVSPRVRSPQKHAASAIGHKHDSEIEPYAQLST